MPFCCFALRVFAVFGFLMQNLPEQPASASIHSSSPISPISSSLNILISDLEPLCHPLQYTMLSNEILQPRFAPLDIPHFGVEGIRIVDSKSSSIHDHVRIGFC